VADHLKVSCKISSTLINRIRVQVRVQARSRGRDLVHVREAPRATSCKIGRPLRGSAQRGQESVIVPDGQTLVIDQTDRRVVTVQVSGRRVPSAQANFLGPPSRGSDRPARDRPVPDHLARDHLA
jgi:hypothetical protein